MAQPFDAARLVLAGEAFPIAGGIDQNTPSASAFFSVSAHARVLTYCADLYRNHAVRGPTHMVQTRRLEVDCYRSAGKVYATAAFSRLAVVSPDPDTGNRDIWLMDLESGSRTRFTSSPANDWWPVWSPDGAYIASHRIALPNRVFIARR
jgi:hypothetical protein